MNSKIYKQFMRKENTLKDYEFLNKMNFFSLA